MNFKVCVTFFDCYSNSFRVNIIKCHVIVPSQINSLKTETCPGDILFYFFLKQFFLNSTGLLKLWYTGSGV